MKINFTHLATFALAIGVNYSVFSQTWDRTGNNILATDWLGTQNNQPLQLRTTLSQPIIFQTNGATERMRLTSTGFLGLGLNAPTSLLHLNSTTTGNLFRTDGPIGSLNQWQLFTNNEKFRLSVPAGSDNVVQNAVNADGSFALQTTFC